MAEENNLENADLVSDVELEDKSNENESITQTPVDPRQAETDFALTLVETLISFNNGEIGVLEAVNRFNTKAEISCFTLFARSLPLNPISAVYPENAFFIFKGVAVPKSVNLTEKKLSEIEEKIKATHDIDNDTLHLHELPPDMLNAFELAVTVYNGKAEKVRQSYFAAVKNAKAQVMEVSAAVVCIIIIITTALALLSN